MSVLLTKEEAILLKALASGQVRLRVGGKAYRVKRIIQVSSFGFRAELERGGRTTTQEVMFHQFETSHSDLMRWLETNAETLDDDFQRLRERALVVRAQ